MRRFNLNRLIIGSEITDCDFPQKQRTTAQKYVLLRGNHYRQRDNNGLGVEQPVLGHN